MAAKKMDLGPTGETVAANVKRLRAGTTYKALADKMATIGRPIAELGLRRIENQERRVDTDDLVALALVFGVSPNTLLMPDAPSESAPVATTALPVEMPAGRVWKWLQGEVGLFFDPTSVSSWWENEKFRHRARPVWDPGHSVKAWEMMSGDTLDELEKILDAAGAAAPHGND